MCSIIGVWPTPDFPREEKTIPTHPNPCFSGGPDPWIQYGRSSGAAAGVSLGTASAASSNGRPEAIGSTFSAAGDENDLESVMAQQYRLPIKRRRLVVLGGFRGTQTGK